MENKVRKNRRKTTVRKTIQCFQKCLNNKSFPLVLKWEDEQSQIFSILYKNKKSPQWSSDYLALFKELDSISISKFEKYKNELDFDQACKRRCKGNLRKLRCDGLLKCLKEERIDKCTRKVYYQFVGDMLSNDQASFHADNDWFIVPGDNFAEIENEQAENGWTILPCNPEDNFAEIENKREENGWIILPCNPEDNFTEIENKREENDWIILPEDNFTEIENEHELSNTSTEYNEYRVESENKNIDNFYPISQNKNLNDFYSTSSNSSTNMGSMFAAEVNMDIQNLINMVEYKEPIQAIGMIRDEEPGEAFEDNPPLWSTGCIRNINREMELNEVIDEL